MLPENVDLSDALVVGAEWFGADHPILKCLELGVAIHHGALPGPFRREIERLLHEGKLKVTIASPTLAQGLNLSASAVLFHGLQARSGTPQGLRVRKRHRACRARVRRHRRSRSLSDLRAEFDSSANASGRTGCGSRKATAARRWTRASSRSALRLLRRMHASRGAGPIEPLLDYLTGGPDWTLPVLQQDSTTTVPQQPPRGDRTSPCLISAS